MHIKLKIYNTIFFSSLGTHHGTRTGICTGKKEHANNRTPCGSKDAVCDLETINICVLK